MFDANQWEAIWADIGWLDAGGGGGGGGSAVAATLYRLLRLRRAR